MGQRTTWQTLQTEILNTAVPALAPTYRMHNILPVLTWELSSCKAREGELTTNAKHTQLFPQMPTITSQGEIHVSLNFVNFTKHHPLANGFWVYTSPFSENESLFHTLSHSEALPVCNHDAEPMPARSIPPGPTSLQCRSGWLESLSHTEPDSVCIYIFIYTNYFFLYVIKAEIIKSRALRARGIAELDQILKRSYTEQFHTCNRMMSLLNFETSSL